MSPFKDFFEPEVQVLLWFSVGQVVDQDDPVKVVVKDVPGISMRVAASNVTQLCKRNFNTPQPFETKQSALLTYPEMLLWLCPFSEVMKFYLYRSADSVRYCRQRWVVSWNKGCRQWWHDRNTDVQEKLSYQLDEPEMSSRLQNLPRPIFELCQS